MPLSGKTIILGVTGGIAAYKSADICSRLVKGGAIVHVVMTENAAKFVGPATFRALTGQPVIIGLWDEPAEYEITHVSLPDKADAALIAPATANILGKAANGIADDMLSTTIMATTAPVIFAPAMNVKMWNNPIVQANVTKLQSLGYRFVMPASGRLACGTVGVGRMADPVTIVKMLEDVLAGRHDLNGMKIIVTAGPTVEPIDPVRFIANRSSGKMGYAIADAASKRGADVTLISGPVQIPPPLNVEFVQVQTVAEMCDAVLSRFDDADILIGAAAPADFTPAAPRPGKIKKTGNGGLSLKLVQTTDILAEAGKRKKTQVLVAFAAETENMMANAQEKMSRKGADFIIANDVSKPGIGFSSDDNEVSIISADGAVRHLPKMPKTKLADVILDIVASPSNA